ncbi:MAG TPA: phosphodiester glycosidase family protein [Telluria sp.]|nr:phosphodiester glycosidase family protein [Telluria sp.]
MKPLSTPARLACLLLALGTCLTCAADAATAELPLGRKGLTQTSRTERVAPGVELEHVRRGGHAPRAHWLLMSGVVRGEAELGRQRSCFTGLGLRAQVDTFRIAGESAEPYQVLQGGKFSSRDGALRAARAAARDGCRLHARHSSEDAGNADGPWDIRIATIAPGATLVAQAGDNARQLRTPTSVLARRAGAALAVNGGFFVEHAEDGFPGQPAGLSILAGQLNSTPVARRPAVIVTGDARRPILLTDDLDWQATLVWSNGERIAVDGVNRQPGLVRNCGRRTGEAPIHDYTCHYQDDLVYFPPHGPFTAMRLTGDRFALDPAGHARRLGADEAAASDESVLVVTPGSDRIKRIEACIAAGATAVFDSALSAGGAGLHPSFAVNAGPTLLRSGAEIRRDAAEGWAMEAVPDDAAHRLLMHEWINRRNPRTAIGIKQDGTVLLVTVDGHDHRRSVGLTIEELRKLMKALGARDALNLDGGGSTALVVNGRLVNLPSDATGERAVGDALAVLTASHPRVSGDASKK